MRFVLVSTSLLLTAALVAQGCAKKASDSKPADPQPNADKAAPEANSASAKAGAEQRATEKPAPPAATEAGATKPAPEAAPAETAQGNPASAQANPESAQANPESAQAKTGEKTPAPAKTAQAEPSGWDNEEALDWAMSPVLVAAVAAPKGAGTGETQAFGRGAGGNAVKAVWNRLAAYERAYLKNWSGAFDEPPGSATDVVDAFNELAYAVTGPTGFWRKTLPMQWLGCRNNTESAPCQKLASASGELKKWDAIQKKLSKLPAGKARQFLTRNQRRLMAYFDNYVPAEINASSIKETAFYKKHLDGVMPE